MADELLRQRINGLTEKIIGCGIEVHEHLGPGLLESAYEECLCFELSQIGIRLEHQVPLPVNYKCINLDCGYKMDIVVEDLVILELKAVERIIPVYEAQLLSYLKLYDKRVGLLLTFHVPRLRDGLKRIVNNF
ncbi:MAG: GxxExxY protein [Pyrinomonadaceae bacterium]